MGQYINLHEVYLKLKNSKLVRPNAEELSKIEDKDEVGFLLCIYDYFLDLKQKELIEREYHDGR